MEAAAHLLSRLPDTRPTDLQPGTTQAEQLIAQGGEVTEYVLVRASEADPPGAESSLVAFNIGQTINPAALAQPVYLHRRDLHEGMESVEEPTFGAGSRFGQAERDQDRRRRIERARKRDPSRFAQAELHMAAQPPAGRAVGLQRFVGTVQPTDNVEFFYIVPDEADEGSGAVQLRPVHKTYHMKRTRKTDDLDADEALKLLESKAKPHMIENALRQRRAAQVAEDNAATAMLQRTMKEGHAEYYNSSVSKATGETGEDELERIGKQRRRRNDGPKRSV
jgi:hypothetical protein